MNRSRLLPTAILLLLAALLMVGGAMYFATHKSLAQPFSRKPSPATSTSTVLPAAPAVVASTNFPPASTTSQTPSAPSASLSNPGDIQFIPREKIAATSVTDHSGDYDIVTSYEFYRVGRFADGAYKGADLLMASISKDEEPCKSAYCGEANFVRYIRKGNVLFPLLKISDPQASAETVGRQMAVDTRPFTVLGATYGQTLDFSVSLLEYPPTIIAGPRAVLRYASESVGSLNPSVLKFAFHDPVYGDVWTTKPDVAPQKAFYDSCSDVNPASHGVFEACVDLPDYTDNAFYFFRPDGTYLSYVYKPDFLPEDPRAVTW